MLINIDKLQNYFSWSIVTTNKTLSNSCFMFILGLETSCDETAAAVLRADKNHPAILSNIVSSQIKLHAKWGGVVPNLAAREHLKNVRPVITAALKGANVSAKDIDLIAVTQGPGLIPALLVGTTAAKTLAYLWQKPLIGIHHIEGHIYANFISDEIGVISNGPFPASHEIQRSQLKNSKKASLKFPLLCLVVSGGHTQLIFMKKHLTYEIIGETLDDAAGEAFDKTARVLGLGYPGGPAIAATAANFQLPISNFRTNSNDKISKNKTEYNFVLPRPMISSKDFNFSFSGLKTAVLYAVKKNESLLKDKNFVTAMSREFQQAAIDVLVRKTIRAAKKYNPQTILLAGGVSANTELRRQLGEAIEKELKNVSYVMPRTDYSIDNAAMIATAAFYRYKFAKNKKTFGENWQKLKTEADLKLSSQNL